MTEKAQEKTPAELQVLLDFAHKLGEQADAGLKKLELLGVPKNCIDPEKWLKVHKPETLQDQEVASALAIYQVVVKKKTYSHFLRKKSYVRYRVILSRNEGETLKDLLREFVVEGIEPNIFYVNMAKGLIAEDGQLAYFYRNEEPLELRRPELSMIFRAFINFTEEG